MRKHIIIHGDQVRSCVALFVLTTAASSSASPADGATFAGLERAYFTRSDGGAEASRSDTVRPLLAARLSPPPRAADSGIAEDVTASDFVLLLGRGAGRVVLRQVLDRSHRITQQWWCLYRDGRRTDCWFFAPDPRRTGRKLLAEYRIEAVTTGSSGRLVFRNCGVMVRPQGAWWQHGKDFVFRVSGSQLGLERVAGRFFVSHGYDLGREEPPGVSFLTEGPPSDRGTIEVRDVGAARPELLALCGYRDPAREGDDPGSPVTCDDWERVARCVTADASAKVRERPANLPSFAERGGRAP